MEIDRISTGLRRGPDGIWYARDQEEVSFPPGAHDRCLAVEEGSFWFRHRNDCIVSTVERYPPAEDGTIFDVGGGNGFVSSGLMRAGFDVALVEPGQAGARNARQRGIDVVVCATLEHARFTPGSLPASGIFDVLEHIRNELDFLRSIRALLVPGGRLYVTVPACSLLWSHEDELAGHFRRYSSTGLADRLAAAGLEVEFTSYFFRFLPLPILLTRTLPYRLGLGVPRIEPARVHRDHVVSSRLLSRPLDLLLTSEVEKLARGEQMRFGASCLAVATRR